MVSRELLQPEFMSLLDFVQPSLRSDVFMLKLVQPGRKAGAHLISVEQQDNIPKPCFQKGELPLAFPCQGVCVCPSYSGHSPCGKRLETFCFRLQLGKLMANPVQEVLMLEDIRLFEPEDPQWQPFQLVEKPGKIPTRGLHVQLIVLSMRIVCFYYETYCACCSSLAVSLPSRYPQLFSETLDLSLLDRLPCSGF